MKKNLMFLLTSGALALSAGTFAASATQLTDQAGPASVTQAQLHQAKNGATQKKTSDDQTSATSATGSNSDGSADSSAANSDDNGNANASSDDGSSSDDNS